MDRKIRWLRIIGWVVTCVAVLYLIMHAYLGSFSRYIADDFCTAGDVLKLGFWGAQSNMYMTWSGRFSFTFLVAVTHLLGPGLTPLLPALAILLWLASMIILFYQVQSSLISDPSWLGSFLLATFTLSVIFTASPNIYQSLYWQTGMLTYAFPLILGTAYLAWLFKLTKSKPNPSTMALTYLTSFLWPLFVGGFSETIVSVQTAGLFLLLGLLMLSKGRKASSEMRLVLFLGFIGSMTAMVIVVMAPGNETRRGLMPPSPEFSTLLRATLLDWYIFSVRTLKWHPLGIGLTLFIPFLTGYLLVTKGRAGNIDTVEASRSIVLWIMVIPVFTFLLMCASIAPYEYAISSFPDGRVLITTLFICILGMGSWGFLLGVGLPVFLTRHVQWMPSLKITLSVLGLVVFLIFIWQASAAAVAELDTMKSYAIAWDTRDSALRSARLEGVNTIEAASLTHMGGGLAEIGYDPDEWINQCIARTYGFDQVIAK